MVQRFNQGAQRPDNQAFQNMPTRPPQEQHAAFRSPSLDGLKETHKMILQSPVQQDMGLSGARGTLGQTPNRPPSQMNQINPNIGGQMPGGTQQPGNLMNGNQSQSSLLQVIKNLNRQVPFDEHAERQQTLGRRILQQRERPQQHPLLQPDNPDNANPSSQNSRVRRNGPQEPQSQLVMDVPPALLQASAQDLIQVRSQRPTLANVPDEQLSAMIVQMKKHSWMQQMQLRNQAQAQAQAQAPQGSTPAPSQNPAPVPNTISQDHTAGEQARRLDLLADFGRKQHHRAHFTWSKEIRTRHPSVTPGLGNLAFPSNRVRAGRIPGRYPVRVGGRTRQGAWKTSEELVAVDMQRNTAPPSDLGTDLRTQ